MNEQQHRDEACRAWRLGFSLKLAEEGLSVSEFADLVEKVASPTALMATGMAAGGLGTAVGGMANLVGAGAIGLPMTAGNAVGRITSSAMDEEVDDKDETRLKIAIGNLRRLIVETKAQRRNELLSQIVKNRA